MEHLIVSLEFVYSVNGIQVCKLISKQISEDEKITDEFISILVSTLNEAEDVNVTFKVHLKPYFLERETCVFRFFKSSEKDEFVVRCREFDWDQKEYIYPLQYQAIEKIIDEIENRTLKIENKILKIKNA